MFTLVLPVRHRCHNIPLLQHPYHGFGSSTQRFVEEAAADKSVAAIKATLYRTNSDSPIITALLKAAEQGKQVCVDLRNEHMSISLLLQKPWVPSLVLSTALPFCPLSVYRHSPISNAFAAAGDSLGGAEGAI